MKTPIKATNWIAFAFMLLALFGCSTVPPESVELSKALGKGISSSREAHVATLTSFYETRKETNDQWILDTFMPRLIQKTKLGFVEACKRKGDTSADCPLLSERDYQTIVKQVIGFRDELQRALEKNRQDSIEVIYSHYASLTSGNVAITGLLTSVVDLKKSTRDAASSVASSLGINVDINKINKTFDEFLVKAGDAASKVQDLQTTLDKLPGKKQ